MLNGTAKRPSAGLKVELLTIQQGMNKSAEAVTQTDGSFQFLLPEDNGSPHWLLRSIYHGVNYNLSVTPTEDLTQPVTLTVYENTDSSDAIEVSLPLMLAQASGNVLFVQQQYLLNNRTQPPRTFSNSKSTFVFDTPSRDLLDELAVSVVGLAGIPLPQEPTPIPAQGFSISYPMKPGVNEIRVSYKVKYPSNQRSFEHKLFYGSKSTQLLVLPASLSVTGAGLKPLGTDSRTQAAKYQIDAIARGSVLRFEMDGDAPVVSEDVAGEGREEPQVQVVRLSNPVFEQRLYILCGFGAIFIAVLLIALGRKAGSEGRRKRRS